MQETCPNIPSDNNDYVSLSGRYAELSEYTSGIETELMRERATREDLVAREVEKMRAALKEEIRAVVESEVRQQYADRERILDRRESDLDMLSGRIQSEQIRLDSDREKMLEAFERRTLELRLKFQADMDAKAMELAGEGIMRLEGIVLSETNAMNALLKGDKTAVGRYLLELRSELEKANAAFTEKLREENEGLKAKVLDKVRQNALLVRNAYLKKHEGFMLTDEERALIQERNDRLPLTDKEREAYRKAVSTVNKYHGRVRAEKEAKRREGKASHGRNAIPENLIRLDPVVIFPEEYNENDYEIIGYDDHEEVIPIKERYMVRVSRRPVVVRKSDPDRTPVQAPLPEGVIYKSCASAELLSRIEYRKYALHLPWYRQEKMMRQEGFPLNRSTMCGWHEEVCSLLDPLYECQINEVMRSRHLAADGCPMPMTDNERHRTVSKYLVGIRSIDTGIPVFRAAPPELFKGNWRGKAVIQYYLTDWKGEAVMCDACSSYDWLRKEPGITLCRCNAHGRREIERALKESRLQAEEGLLTYQQIYGLEAMAKYDKIGGDAKTTFRLTYEKPLWDYLYKWCLENLPKVKPGSLMEKAIKYILRHYDELTAYLTIPEMPIDNNDTERAIREMVMGKQAYLFCENEESCYNAAMMYTFFGACKVLGKNPERWLAYALKHIKDCPKERLPELLPQNWNDNEN